MFIVLIVLFVVITSIVVAVFAFTQVAGGATAIELHEFKEKERLGWKILDVRTEAEFNAGHIPGAVHVDFYDSEFEARVTVLPKAVGYLLYCKTGSRSRKAVRLMRDLGFPKVFDLKGGYVGYVGKA